MSSHIASATGTRQEAVGCVQLGRGRRRGRSGADDRRVQDRAPGAGLGLSRPMVVAIAAIATRCDNTRHSRSSSYTSLDGRPRIAALRSPLGLRPTSCATASASAACAGRRSGASSSTSCRGPTGHITGASSSSAAGRSTRPRRRRPSIGRSTCSRSSASSATATRPDGREEFHVLPERGARPSLLRPVPEHLGDPVRGCALARPRPRARAAVRGRRDAPDDQRDV